MSEPFLINPDDIEKLPVNFVNMENIPNKARLTVVIKIYHERPGRPSSCVPITYSRFLERNEQPYERELDIGEEWTKLGFGWLQTTPSLIVLRNLGASHMLLADYSLPQRTSGPAGLVLVIPPGEGQQIMPQEGQYPHQLHVKSTKGIQALLVNVFPS